MSTWKATESAGPFNAWISIPMTSSMNAVARCGTSLTTWAFTSIHQVPCGCSTALLLPLQGYLWPRGLPDAAIHWLIAVFQQPACAHVRLVCEQSAGQEGHTTLSNRVIPRGFSIIWWPCLMWPTAWWVTSWGPACLSSTACNIAMPGRPHGTTTVTW